MKSVCKRVKALAGGKSSWRLTQLVEVDTLAEEDDL